MLVTVVAAGPFVTVLMMVWVAVVLQITEALYDFGAFLALITTAAAAGGPGGTEVVSKRIGVNPLGVGMVVVPDGTVFAT